MKQEKISNIEHISVGSKKIPLKSERLKQAFKRIESQTNELEQLEKSLDATGQDATNQQKIGELIKGYLILVDIIDDTQSVIKKEKAEESKTSEQSGQLYNILIIYT